MGLLTHGIISALAFLVLRDAFAMLLPEQTMTKLRRIKEESPSLLYELCCPDGIYGCEGLTTDDDCCTFLFGRWHGQLYESRLAHT